MGLENPLHIAVLVVLVLLLFGAKRLPEIGRSLGTGMREFKQSITGETPTHQQPALPATQQHQPQAPVPAPPAEPVAVAPPEPAAIAPPAPPQAAAAEPQQQS